MSGVFQDELFEVEEGSFVRDFLTHLYNSSPCVGCETFRTIWTLVVCNDVFDLKGLLEDGSLKCFLLDSDLHFDSSRMRFRPYKAGVYDPNFREAS